MVDWGAASVFAVDPTLQHEGGFGLLGRGAGAGEGERGGGWLVGRQGVGRSFLVADEAARVLQQERGALLRYALALQVGAQVLQRRVGGREAAAALAVTAID